MKRTSTPSTAEKKRLLDVGLRKTAVRRHLRRNARARQGAAQRLEDRYVEFHELIREALDVEIPVTEIARLSNTNRQRIYDMARNPQRPPRVAESDRYTKRKGGK